ncbi:MAG: glycoside hydrolase family 97 N-terminal domain-containing protein, partial [Anaerolineae bacterium]
MCQTRNTLVLVILCCTFLLIACASPETTPTPPPTRPSAPEESAYVSSPDGKVQVTFTLVDGVPYYQVSRSSQDIIRPSKLGFIFKDAEPLNQNLTIAASTLDSFDETWTQPWGEVKEIRNHYNELRVNLEESTEAHRRMTIVFRVYDDGLGFRYELPEQDNLSDFEIMDEETEFALAGNHKVWWI